MGGENRANPNYEQGANAIKTSHYSLLEYINGF